MLERKPHHLHAAVWGKNQRKTRRREPAPFGNLPAHTLLHHAQGENPSGNLPSKAGGGMSWRAHRSSSGCTQTKVRSPAIGQPCWPNFHWCPALARRTINHHRPIPACTGDRECCAPACSREASSCPNPNPVVRHSIRCNGAPRLSEVQGPDDARHHRADTRQGRRLAYV